MKEAMLYEKLPGDRIRCHLCAHRCLLASGNKGLCHVRENRDGTLYTLVYGRNVTRHIEPIEKKPLFHFEPGSVTYSVGTPGCNCHCRWCQNWKVSQPLLDNGHSVGQEFDPTETTVAALHAGCQSIAYTYTEPTVFFEYACETAQRAHEAGLANIFVTNGYMTADALNMLQPYLDAANVDLKTFRDETYRQYVGARLQPVLDTLKAMVRMGIWLEVTTLVVPGVNDDPAELKDLTTFVADELGADTPWHISRLFPAYKMAHVPPTSADKLRRARMIGLAAGLRYVYVGNTSDEENTYCHRCGQLLVRRFGYRILEKHITRAGKCPDCGTRVAGVWTLIEDSQLPNVRLVNRRSHQVRQQQPVSESSNGMSAPEMGEQARQIVSEYLNE